MDKISGSTRCINSRIFSREWDSLLGFDEVYKYYEIKMNAFRRPIFMSTPIIITSYRFIMYRESMAKTTFICTSWRMYAKQADYAI